MPSRLRDNPLNERVFAALILIQILFGMNYILSKVVLAHFPPLVWASIRAIGTAVLLVAFSLVRGKLYFRRGLYYYRQLILFSLLGVVLNQGLFLLGLSYTTPTNSAILNTLIPVFTVLIVAIRGQESISRKRAVGFLFAFLGVLFIHRPEDFSISSTNFLGDLYILLNTASYAFFLSYSQRFFERLDFVWSTTWLFIYGAIGMTIFALPSYMAFTFTPLSTETWMCIITTIIAGTVLPYLLISYTLARTHSSVVALFIYIQPLVAAALSYLFFREEIHSRSLIAGALIFTGVILATSKGSEVDPEKVISLDFEKHDATTHKKVHKH